MNTNDFISLNGVKWGKHPYYINTDNNTYDEGLIYFATFGCKKAFQYKDFAEGMTSIDVNKKSDYLSLYNNGGLKEYYGDGLFQKNNNLATSEDFIRNKNTKIAIPTEEELINLINNSDIYCTKTELIIHPYVKNDNDEKRYTDEITIPLLGVVDYIADNTATTTKYNVRNGSLKQVGFGFHKGVHENDLTDELLSEFPFVIVETRYTSNGLSSYKYYKCYQSGYTYSDVFLLTSNIPKDEDTKNMLTGKNKNGETFARVLRIEIEAKTLADDPSTPEVGDVEFLTFEIKENSKKEQLIYFDNIRCCDGTSAEIKDRGFMVLPIKYDDYISVETNGGLLLNEEEFSSYNQETGGTESHFVIEPFGIPAITNGNYDYDHDFKNPIGAYPISTSFFLPNGSEISIKDFKSYSYIDDDKIKVVSDTNKSYWIVSNNECLYIKETSANTYNLIFDDRPLFFKWTKSGITHTTTLYIDTNIDYQGQYTVSSDRFVLPSIYKPFYIKRIYSIDRFGDEELDEYYYGVYTSVYNGIGLFAHKGERSSDAIFTSALKRKLNSYFNNDDTFSKNFEGFYEEGKYDDIYVVGYTNDKIVLSTSEEDKNGIEIFGNYPLPIYRKRPLILSDYNNSVFDFLDNFPSGYSYGNSNRLLRTFVSTNEYFKSVEEPKTKMPFNKNKMGGIMSGSTEVNFGGIDIGTTKKIAKLFGKGNVSFINGIIGVDSSDTGDSSTKNENLAKYISNGRKNGIRYYLVNHAFYCNYINYAYPNMINTIDEYFSNFIKYNDEYYKNREYYDLNPHLVDFRDSDKWYVTTDTVRIAATNEYLEFYLVPENDGLKVDSEYDVEINGKDTLLLKVNKNSINYYNVVSDIKEIEYTELRYRASFWILNSDYATIRVRVNLGDYKNIEDFSSFEDETIGNTPYRIFIIKPGEKRYLEFIGYPFNGGSVKVWIGPEYKNADNEYYQIKFSITTVTFGEVEHILPFFDMIPALKNTNGYVYSDKRTPNVNAPMAIELYTYSGNTVEFVRQSAITEEGLEPTFLIGVYSNLTKLNGPCRVADETLDEYSGYTESDNIYCNQIQNGTEILPQNNNITIIYCYGYTRGFRTKN